MERTFAWWVCPLLAHVTCANPPCPLQLYCMDREPKSDH